MIHIINNESKKGTFIYLSLKSAPGGSQPTLIQEIYLRPAIESDTAMYPETQDF